MAFAAAVAENLLVRSARSCCLCRTFKGTKLEIHHIVPEEQGGTDEEDNGIPICFDCHADIESYNAKHPRGRRYRGSELKRLRDEWFRLVTSGVHDSHVSERVDEDREIVRFLAQCFQRPAFADPFHREGTMEHFDKAIEDTITAISTGCLRSRDGATLARSKGMSYLSNREWRERMEVIWEMLRAIRASYALALRRGQITRDEETGGGHWHLIRDAGLGPWMDHTRQEVLTLFASICDEADVHVPHLRSNRYSPWSP
jgi:hypothetical protein